MTTSECGVHSADRPLESDSRVRQREKDRQFPERSLSIIEEERPNTLDRNKSGRNHIWVEHRPFRYAGRFCNVQGRGEFRFDVETLVQVTTPRLTRNFSPRGRPFTRGKRATGKKEDYGPYVCVTDFEIVGKTRYSVRTPSTTLFYPGISGSSPVWTEFDGRMKT